MLNDRILWANRVRYEIDPGGTALVYSTVLGGGADAGFGITVDEVGSAYVAGQTSSSNFPTVDPLQLDLGGATDAFVTKLAAGAEPAPIILTNGIVNGASFRPATNPNGAVAPGAIVSIFGHRLQGRDHSAAADHAVRHYGDG